MRRGVATRTSYRPEKRKTSFKVLGITILGYALFSLSLIGNLYLVGQINYYKNLSTTQENLNLIAQIDQLNQKISDLNQVLVGTLAINQNLTETNANLRTEIENMNTTVNNLRQELSTAEHKAELIVVTMSGSILFPDNPDAKAVWIEFVGGGQRFGVDVDRNFYSIKLINRQDYRVNVHYNTYLLFFSYPIWTWDNDWSFSARLESSASEFQYPITIQA